MRQEKPLISIIMPAYNCEAYIKDAVDSVLGQTYEYWELIVADDGSKDNTRIVIDSFQDSRIIKSHNKVNQGNIKTRNRLFEEAKGAFLTVLDADDIMTENRLEKQLNAFQKDPGLGACVSNYYEVDIQGEIKLKQPIKENFIVNTENFFCSFTFPPATIMLKKEVYDKVGGLNLYFDRLFAEDRYWIYLIVEQSEILFIADALYYYRTNPFSLTNYLDNPRKLTITTLVDELIRQRKKNGTDWLSEGQIPKALAFEETLMTRKTWLAEKYRICAARHIDLLDLTQAGKLLFKAIRLYPFNINNVRTLIYMCKTLNNKII